MLTADVLGERTRLTPDKLALVDIATGRRLTYRELDDRARRCGRVFLESLALAPGDRVAVLCGNRVEFLDTFFAAAKTGIILVPLGTRLTAHELAVILGNCRPRVLMYDGDHAAVVGALLGELAIPQCVAFDGPSADGHLSYSSLFDAVSDGGAFARPDPEAPCCLLYTSGTTGVPKGVIVPHRMVGWNGYNTALSWQLQPDDVSPIFTPLYHAGGLGAFLVPILTVGGTIVLHRGFDIPEVWRAIEQERCTVVLGVPTIYKLMAEAPEFKTVDLSHLRYLISGGAPLPLHIIETYQARGVVFKQGYGLTEVGVNCFAMTVADSVRKAGSVGRPMMFTEARLADEGGAEVPVGEVGELWLRGPHVCKGYWENPEATAAALDGDGWFHTGDLARRDTDDFFYIAGRRKDMLISGGVNVYPAEIEGELLLHPSIADAAVVGIPHETWGEIGVAFVVLRPGYPADPDGWAAFLGQKLARYKIPRAFVAVESLPRTPYGKVVKGQLRDRFLASGGHLG